MLNLLEHMNDSAAQVPRRQLSKLLYGRDSVYARSPTPDQVRRLTRDDVVAHLATWQRPDLAVLGVAGPFLCFLNHACKGPRRKKGLGKYTS